MEYIHGARSGGQAEAVLCMRGVCHSRGQLLMPRISEFVNIFRGGLVEDCNSAFHVFGFE